MSETRAHAGGTKIIVVSRPPGRILIKIERLKHIDLPGFDSLALDPAEARALIEALMVEVG